ncbi:unnamed protein product [Miscanthus lutarioriparius]|uniref:Xyloglucan endotransglucosylase/hydrolase n=1 Tax=Miscanthus lutarioriparius TaxID=422564 RepID=A0A811SMH0_9POAL|nr:unnamed protein product [Miscanthus lutarioriparius]
MAASSGDAQPSPGYYPSSRFRPVPFNRAYTNKWGPQHQTLSGDHSSLTIWLDRTCGSGFKSKHAYWNGYFSTRIKLPAGYTAGTNTAFYTNVYVRGSGDGRIVGREMRFHLWFDPTAAYHTYAIMWNPDAITFFVDDVPVRRYERRAELTFPDRPMWVYGSIWDASDWATDDGRHRADYRYQPFVARLDRFVVAGCSVNAPPACRPVPASPAGAGLTAQQYAAMRWAQREHMVYYYCNDFRRDHSLTPEC